jgi:hypothetical protein
MIEYSNAKKILTRNENSMNMKTPKTIKRHVAALPIQTGRSRGWRSNGSGLRSVGISLGSLRRLEDAEEIRNGRICTIDLMPLFRIYISLRLGFAGAWHRKYTQLSHQLMSLLGSCPRLIGSFMSPNEHD